MIKAEVVFDENKIKIMDFSITYHDGLYYVYRNEKFIEQFGYQEEAVKYCMEQSKWKTN